MAEIVEAQVLDVDGTQAPATLDCVCTRTKLLDPPDWRYRQAADYVNAMRHETAVSVPTDPVVQYLVRGLVASAFKPQNEPQCYVSRPNALLLQCWPDFMEAMYHGTMARRSAVSAIMDACLIKGWSFDEARMAGCPVNRTVYNLYAKAFFDLSGVRTVASWIHDHLFEPERYVHNSSLLRTRLMAFYGNGRAGTSSSVLGAMDTDEKALMSSISKNERQKQVFDYMVKHTQLEPEVYAGMMETALKNMSDQEFQQRLHDQEMAGSGSLEELADNLEVNIRAFSMQEIQGYDTKGLDFVNQFTGIITGTQDDGKENITAN